MLDFFDTFLDSRVAGFHGGELLLCFGLLVATLVVRRVVGRLVMETIARWAAKTEAIWDEALVTAFRPPLDTFILFYGVMLSLNALTLPVEPFDIGRLIGIAGSMGIIVIVGWALWRLVGVMDVLLSGKIDDPNHWLDVSVVQIVGNAFRIMILMTTGILAAQNLGYSVGGLIASLGIGGAAVALASKDTIANLFGSMMILIDKPFKVGDWVKGSGFEGVVEEIGFRSTRIRTFGKTMEVLPNNVMANVLVENMDRRKDEGLNVRRINMTIGVTYRSTPDQMEALLAGIKKIIHEDEGVDQRMTILVRFTDFGESSLDVFIYYFSNSADWDYYLSVRERVNLKIMRLVAELGMSMAFPSRSVYLESVPPFFKDRV